MLKIHQIIVLSLGIILASCSSNEKPAATKDISLRFNDQGTFKILQLTDTHICWERQDEYVKALRQLCYMLDTEKPDIAIFTGDVVTGIGADSSWVNFLKPFDEREIPFVVTLGNHDREQELTERQIADIVLSHPMSLNTAKSGFFAADRAIREYAENIWHIN